MLHTFEVARKLRLVCSLLGSLNKDLNAIKICVGLVVGGGCLPIVVKYFKIFLFQIRLHLTYSVADKELN